MRWNNYVFYPEHVEWQTKFTVKTQNQVYVQVYTNMNYDFVLLTWCMKP